MNNAIGNVPDLLRAVRQADRDGLDLVSVMDHPYTGDQLDAYAFLGFVLGATERLTGFANVTNLPTRPAPMLARTVTSLSALSGGRVVLGLGVGLQWDRIADMGVPRLSPGEAVAAFEEAIVLVKQLAGGGPPVTYEGTHYRVNRIDPAPVAAPEVWTGSSGPKSLAATGRVADGWLPPYFADWLSERYRTSRPVIDEAATAAGRDPGEVRTIYNFAGRIAERPLNATRDEDGRWVGGSAAQWVEELTGAVLEHGAAGFNFAEPHGFAEDLTVLGRWANEIVPAVREAVAKEQAGD
ncbi:MULTISPECIES: LLM class flavin-dependent oxidoreductase [unclassified Amycolatopsis]|uniref:LLM class flavin-dependent oxidoreductase n=1 Tax=unclassified Amycolatopsis TaxID=2618356 RepID=UPI0027DC9B82|nr:MULTISPECIES: LLM class flavin-dependent oxidoreductase [unclassified Amycolatopsis]HET6706648.1 LLM class flavin-dependent oxidoreductase [Amycolatopsis sp.]